jgi:serine/threonine-protein kinase
MPDRRQLPLDVLDRIDQICDRFEAAWEAGDRPRIEDFLGEAAEAYRTALVRDLLAGELNARRRRGERPEPAEYRDRLPGEATAIASAFRVQVDQPGLVEDGTETMPDVRRSLLFGLLSYQNGLIDQSALVDTLRAWVKDKTRSVADSLVARGALDTARRALLERLIVEHVKLHDGDIEKSLAALPAGKSTRERLGALGDAEIEATIAQVGTATGSTEPEGDGPVCDSTFIVGVASTQDQRFHILRPHAQGGLGVVFVALDQELHREVALKQILDHHADDQESRARFLREAEITGGLEHPGIVPVYGLGTYTDGRPYYAMRFVRGDSLKEAIERFHARQGSRPVGWVERSEAHQRASASQPVGLEDATHPTKHPGQRSLELRKLLRRFLDVCNTIAYAHSRGVLHRDLKPANVILGNHGETLVVDWGLAKPLGWTESETPGDERPLLPSSASGSAETLPGSALGTPAYMSPEQASGELDRLGPRSDVYSLGATLYCLLTGRPPFEGEDVGAVLLAVQHGEVQSPRIIDPTLDRPLEAICLRAMALRPEDRYPRVRALADDLERWLADEPVSAWREPLARRAGRWARQNRSLVTAGSAAVLVALAGLAAVLAVQTQANGRLRQANVQLGIANAKVTRANADLQAAGERERQRFDLAVEAIRRYHTDVSEDFLLKQDQFKDLRDRLLRDAIEFYRKLESLLSDQTDDPSRRALARAYEEVGDLTGKIGSFPEALEVHRKALDVRRALAREAPSDSATGAEVVRSLTAIGILLGQLGRNDEALGSFEKARSVLGELAKTGVVQDTTPGDYVRLWYWTGNLHYRAGRTGEAMAAFEAARTTGEGLAASHPDLVENQRVLAWCQNDIGILLFQEGKMKAALTAFEASRRIKQRVAEEHPGVAEYRRDLAITHHNIGSLLRESGRLAEALAAHEATLAIQRALAATYPAVTGIQRDLANGLNEAGDVLRLMGRPAEAQASYEQALAILEGLSQADPNVSEYQTWLVQGLKGLGATHFAAGRAADAVVTWRRAITIEERMRSPYDELFYYLAGCHAFLGAAAAVPGSGLSAEEGPVELGRALDALRRAIAAGYRDVTWMQRDSDLDPLRSRPDFQVLLLDLAFPADPFDR